MKQKKQNDTIDTTQEDTDDLTWSKTGRFRHDPVNAMKIAIEWSGVMSLLGIRESQEAIDYRLKYIEELFKNKGIIHPMDIEKVRQLYET